jgi:hypothetical protein
VPRLEVRHELVGHLVAPRDRLAERLSQDARLLQVGQAGVDEDDAAASDATEPAFPGQPEPEGLDADLDPEPRGELGEALEHACDTPAVAAHVRLRKVPGHEGNLGKT